MKMISSAVFHNDKDSKYNRSPQSWISPSIQIRTESY